MLGWGNGDPLKINPGLELQLLFLDSAAVPGERFIIKFIVLLLTFAELVGIYFFIYLSYGVSLFLSVGLNGRST
ncbi:hypothetical protein CRV06_05290 [Halarcobacter anaerophilus]|uniref:Uncharacterized protein n=1 Tax=Halarcobacter anaerophilus TaxID=877500 RepID=A0A4V1LQ64_9BACT|nr:putative membrane protein [Halarcobacter anaerophilus]RXJ63608.1 hypothetical protein CRV06_05290 [Halarcobacter anaerophilus]